MNVLNIQYEDSEMVIGCKCSECNYEYSINKIPKYCPNCGREYEAVDNNTKDFVKEEDYK